MEIRFSTTSHAALVSASNGRGDQRVFAAIPVSLENPDGPVPDLSVALRQGAESFATAASHDIATYTRQVRPAKLRDAAVRSLSGPIQNAISGGRAAKRELQAARLRLLTVPTADATTALVRQDDRAQFSALSLGDKAAWIQDASVEQLGALIEVGRPRFSDVTPEIWGLAEDRYAALNFVRMAGTAADFARQSTVDDPLAIGVDMEAAEQAANRGMERQRTRSEAFPALEQAIQGIVGVVALTCEMDLAGAFDMLTTGQAHK